MCLKRRRAQARWLSRWRGAWKKRSYSLVLYRGPDRANSAVWSGTQRGSWGSVWIYRCVHTHTHAQFGHCLGVALEGRVRARQLHLRPVHGRCELGHERVRKGGGGADCLPAILRQLRLHRDVLREQHVEQRGRGEPVAGGQREERRLCQRVAMRGRSRGGLSVPGAPLPHPQARAHTCTLIITITTT